MERITWFSNLFWYMINTESTSYLELFLNLLVMIPDSLFTLLWDTIKAPYLLCTYLCYFFSLLEAQRTKEVWELLPLLSPTSSLYWVSDPVPHPASQMLYHWATSPSLRSSFRRHILMLEDKDLKKKDRRTVSPQCLQILLRWAVKWWDE